MVVPPKVNIPNPTFQFRAPKFSEFFDRAQVVNRLNRKERQVLTRIGGFIRTTARRSMRKGGKTDRARISSPGQAPRYHTKLLRGFTGSRFGVFFAYNPNRNSVVVGPNLLPGKQKRVTIDKNSKVKTTTTASDTVPAVLETGGSVSFRRRGKSTRAKLAARPYMKPAYDKSLAAPKLRQFWNQVRF